MKDHYAVLNVHPKADGDVIKAAFRVLIKKHYGNDDMMRRIQEANDVLCSDKRSDYDESIRPTGKVFGEYKIIKKIAEGGFGTTYLAEHIALGTKVCIKHALNVSPEDTALLLDEAVAIWDLRHYGIPASKGVIKMPDGSYALVMSYVPGPTLAEAVDDDYPNGIEPEHVSWIIERNLNILKYLHMHGVVHGDVKPQNIILQPESHMAVLVDYGLSKVKPKAHDKAKGYTPYFASPEQRDGKVILPESDFYSLGMTAIFALGGNVEYIKVPESTPKPLCEFIKKLIKREVLARPNWRSEDLCETIKQVRHDSFGRAASAMKPMKLSWKPIK